MGGCDSNIAKSMESTIYERTNDIINAEDFEKFYKIFEQELFKTLDKIDYYYNKFQSVRARDVNLVSTMFFEGSIERAKSITQGGAKNAVANCNTMGITTVIDSLAIINQFVYEEKIVTITELINALKANWSGYEDLHSVILKKGKFFGNDDDTSNYVAQRIYTSFYKHLKDKKNVFGYQWLVGDLLGYNEHHKWFGEKTKATPDGRFDGDLIKFGIGQSEGKDREGLTALLNSIAKLDSYGISCGSTVTNISLDEQLIKNDDYFEKTVDMFETYFNNGGIHFQLTYVSKEELIAAKKDAEKYKNLRVRVTGFSDYFVKLRESIQDDIIERTSHNG